METSQGGNKLLDAERVFEETNIREGMKVAELGCGNTGHFIFPMAKMVGEEGVVYAVDILENALSGIKSRNKLEQLKNIKTVRSNLETFGATNIEPNSLDIAYLINTLHQNKKQFAVIRESARLLRKRGLLVVIDWESYPKPLNPSYVERVSKDNIKNFSNDLNLVLLKDFKAGPYHFGLVFQKL